MEVIVSSLIGGFIGLLLGVIFERPLQRIWESLIHRIMRIFRVTKIPDPIPYQFAFGPIETPTIVIDGDGQVEYTPDRIICHYDPTPLDLPEEIEQIKARIAEREREKRLAGEPYMWNGLTYGLTKYSIGRTAFEEHPELTLWFMPSDWFTHLATSHSLDSEHVTDPQTGEVVSLREKYFSDVVWSRPGVQPVQFFSNSVGVVVSLISSDDQLILVRRSDLVGPLKGVYNIAINEGVQRPFDRSAYDDAPDLYRTVIRGAAEEIGLELSRAEITFLALLVDINQIDWVLEGFVRTSSTVDEIINTRRLGAKDKWEGQELIPVRFDAREVVKFIATHEPWSPGALACIYHTLVHEFGKRVVEQAIAELM